MTKVVRITAYLGVVVALMPAAARAEQRSETRPYTIGSDALLTECELDVGVGTGFGGACFALVGNETGATIEIKDLTGLPVGGAYGFRNGAGTLTSLGLFCQKSPLLTVPSGSAELIVYVTGPAFGTVNCIGSASPGAGTVGTITVTYELSHDTTPPGLDEERECLEAVPAAASVAGVTDDGAPVALTVKVLLDGVPQARAEAIFATAAKSYQPLGITMSVTSFETVAFSGVDAQLLINQAKAREGGKRPDGVDVVYTLTTKDIEAIGQTGVAGLADCVGGIRFDERSFAVGEVISFENLQIGPVTMYKDATARTVAHEIGHLMGGQHHLANCVEDADGDGANGEATPCALMFNSLDALGPDFGTLNGAVVRGHANEYATP